MTKTLIEKLEAIKHIDPNHPRGIGYNEGVSQAIEIVRRHEADVTVENDRVRIAGQWYVLEVSKRD